MAKYFLYVKTHKQTGLKYLGYTGKKDPFKYKGSGDYWLEHIGIHGYDVHTEILLETDSKEEIKKHGEHYSKLWDVVNLRDDSGKKIWANLKPESGDGAPSGKDNHMFNPAVKQRHAAKISDPEIKKKHREATTRAMNHPVVKRKLIAARNTKEYKEFLKTTLHTPEILENRGGEKNPRYNNTIFTFRHKNGKIETCTSYQLRVKYDLDQGAMSRLVAGQYKRSKGWEIIK